MVTANSLNFKLPSDCSPNSKCPLNDNGYVVHLPDNNNCHKFFKCTRGFACSKECPRYGNGNQLVFNPKEQVCDWPFNVPNLPNCIYPGQSISTSSTKTETTTSSTTTSSMTPSTTTSSITPSTTTSSITPSTTTSSITPSTTTQSTTTSVIPEKPCSGTENIEDKTDCRYYYVYDCKTGKKWRQKCQEGLVFNPIIESCDKPANSPCSTTIPLRK